MEKEGFMNKQMLWYEKEIPLIESYDAAVIGAGPSGCMAALAAAARGCRTLLIEKNGYCGGMLTSGLPIQGFQDGKNRPLVRGTAWDFIRELKHAGGTSGTFVSCSFHNPYLIIDPEIVKIVLQRMLADAGVRVCYDRMLADVLSDAADPNGSAGYRIVTAGKEGLLSYRTQYLIDATGDGDGAFLAGIPFTVGRSGDGLTQSATLNVTIRNVDLYRFGQEVRKHPDQYDLDPGLDINQIACNRPHIMVGLRKAAMKAKSSGLYGNLAEFVCYVTASQSDTVVMNMIHIDHVSGHTAQGLSLAEQQARESVEPMIKFLRDHLPGFENAAVSSTPGSVGIRESRHVSAEKTITEDDVRNGTMPSDTAALGGYPMDIHHPEKGDVTLEHVPPYGIPFRCMIPKEKENFLITGRAISADHAAFASLRVMATCMALGQAAGTAAALAKHQGCTVSGIPINVLQRWLKDDHAVLQTEEL